MTKEAGGGGFELSVGDTTTPPVRGRRPPNPRSVHSYATLRGLLLFLSRLRKGRVIVEELPPYIFWHPV